MEHGFAEPRAVHKVKSNKMWRTSIRQLILRLNELNDKLSQAGPTAGLAQAFDGRRMCNLSLAELTSPRPNKAFHTLATSFRCSFSQQVRHEAEQRLVSNHRCCMGCWEPRRLRTQQGCTDCQLDQSCNQRKPRKAEGTCAMRMTFSSQEHQVHLPASPSLPATREDMVQRKPLCSCLFGMSRKGTEPCAMSGAKCQGCTSWPLLILQQFLS